MVKSPALRGMNGNSNDLLPEVPPLLLSVFSVVFVSYTSKSGGKLTLGSSRRETFPLPETVMTREPASWVLSSSEDRRADIPKLPTPPPNEAGWPAGRAFTLTLRAEVDTLADGPVFVLEETVENAVGSGRVDSDVDKADEFCRIDGDGP